MFKKIIPLLLAAALCLNSAMAKPAIEGAAPGKWTQDYEAALKVAAEKNLPLMLNFTGSDWCGWCKLMDKKVFAEEEWADYAKENLMLVTLDFPRDKSIVPAKWVGRNNELKGKFGVKGYPSYIVLDKDGETKLGQLGASREATPKSFIEQTKDAIFFSDAALSKLTKGMPKEKAKAFDTLLADHKKAKNALSDWLATRPRRNPENDKKFTDFKKKIADSMDEVKSFK